MTSGQPRQVYGLDTGAGWAHFAGGSSSSASMAASMARLSAASSARLTNGGGDIGLIHLDRYALRTGRWNLSASFGLKADFDHTPSVERISAGGGKQ